MPSSDWRELLDDGIAVREDRNARRSMAVNYPNELYTLVMEAARARGLNMTAYQRRASLAFAEYDTGFDWAKELTAEPAIGTFTQPRARVEHEGRDFGHWRIVRLDRHE